MERVESALRVVIALTEAHNRHDVAAMMELMTDGCIYDYASPGPDGMKYSGKPAITRFFQDFFARFPQAHLTIEETIGMGLSCAILWRFDWLDAAGEKQHLRGVDLFRVQNGLISDAKTYIKG
jgi:ketosteroid isomerase-like protein